MKFPPIPSCKPGRARRKRRFMPKALEQCVKLTKSATGKNGTGRSRSPSRER